MYINYLIIPIYFLFIQTIVYSFPIYNPLTRCHELILANENRTVSICLQRAANKHHPYNLFTSPEFCSKTYPPNGQLIDLISLSKETIEKILQNLIELFNTKTLFLDLPEPNFLWISSNYTESLVNNSFWCSNECQSKNVSKKFLILKLRCQNKPCITTRSTHWDRAPFMCLTDQINNETKTISSRSNSIVPTYPNNTIVFYDSTPCVIVRTNTHQYTFCFRRQLCPQSQKSAFCTSKFDAYQICHQEKNDSNLLTIENDQEYELINDVITYYSNQSLLDTNGTLKNKYVIRAQWMWIDGLKGLNDVYGWNSSGTFLTPIGDKYWCDRNTNCLGDKRRDHVILNIVCQSEKKTSKICLASRRHSEPGPFICKRTLKQNEESILNFTYLKDMLIKSPSEIISPVYDKNSTSIYYDEDHCLTVQSRTHLYTFCLRRQECYPRKAYCTKWSVARKNCQLLKNNSQLLTIDNYDERILISDIMENYLDETRLTYNGSSYRYFQLADFLWIDGIQQKDNQTYLWKDGREQIPNEYWCPKNQCTSTDHPRVMLNVLCQKNQSLLCLGTRLEWKPAPYICKRIRPIDICPILFDDLRSIQWNEMLVITVNRTIALIKCKNPEYNTEIKVQYECQSETKQWKLIYQNKNFTCPGYKIPSMAIIANTSSIKTVITTPSSTIQSTKSNLSILFPSDCSQSEVSSFIAQLPTESRYVYPSKQSSRSSSYYDLKLTCYFNNLIQITYRCDLNTKQWLYVYGNTYSFHQCSPPCSNQEQKNLLNKYFSLAEQSRMRWRYIDRKQSLRIRCFNYNEKRWKNILYKCKTNTITKVQWFKLHSCFQTRIPIAITTTTTKLPDVMVSLNINQLAPKCPPAVVPGSPCEHQPGEYITDTNGCLRKICPTMSSLCQTIRCPPDRICRVIPCSSCIYTNYLQAVCEQPIARTLCELQRQLAVLDDFQSIDLWEGQALTIVRRYANDQRQRLRSSGPILTIN